MMSSASPWALMPLVSRAPSRAGSRASGFRARVVSTTTGGPEIDGAAAISSVAIRVGRLTGAGRAVTVARATAACVAAACAAVAGPVVAATADVEGELRPPL
jgi:hypothetical protein